MMISPDSLIGVESQKSHKELVQAIAEKVVEHLAREVEKEIGIIREHRTDEFINGMSITTRIIKHPRDWAKILKEKEHFPS